MIIDRYRQQPNENRRRLVDYTEWLDTEENLVSASTAVTPSTSPPLSVVSVTILDDLKQLEYFTSGGASSTEYTVTITVTTTDGQIREDEVTVTVEEDSG